MPERARSRSSSAARRSGKERETRGGGAIALRRHDVSSCVARGSVNPLPLEKSERCQVISGGGPYSAAARERGVPRGSSARPSTPRSGSRSSRSRKRVLINNETLWIWVRCAETDPGQRPGLTADERERRRDLEQDNKELHRADEIVKWLPRPSSAQSSAASARGDLFVDARRGWFGAEPIGRVLSENGCKVATSTSSVARTVHIRAQFGVDLFELPHEGAAASVSTIRQTRRPTGSARRSRKPAGQPLTVTPHGASVFCKRSASSRRASEPWSARDESVRASVIVNPAWRERTLNA